MTKAVLGIIGGSGLYELPGLQNVQEKRIASPWGEPSAPLVVGDLVVSGVSGGDEGVRGFVAAFDQATGREAWRFWTVPARGEPGSETWQGTAASLPCRR